MRLSPALLLLMLARPVAAQDAKPILPSEPPPSKMLHTFLLKEAQRHFDARRDVVSKLNTPEEIKARQAMLKKKFLEALGDLPEKTPLNPKITGTIKADGYRIEKVIFESRPDHHVTGLLYIPDGKGPFPGVLIPCGHSVNGKAADAYQRASILMALNGMVAFCYDPIGQGERLQLLDKEPGKGGFPKAAIPGSTSEHSLVGVGALLVGRSTASYRIWDGIRALDYLASRPEVDAKKLGCSGNSGGGTLTSYLMALDDRIVCAAPSCYITTLERLFATIGPQDAEQNIPGQVAFGMDHADYLTMRAPLPTLMAVATQDFFDIKGAWTSYHEASGIYKKLGAADRMAIFEFDDKHGWSKPRREAAMRWLRKWLVGKDDNPMEGDFTHLKDADLQCTRTGQVLEDFRGVSAFDWNRIREEELRKERAKFVGLKREDQERTVRSVLRLPTKALEPTFKTVVGRTLMTSEPGIELELLATMKKGMPENVVILTEDRSSLPKWRAWQIIVESADALMIHASLRGFGKTAPGELKAGKAPYFGVDFKESFLSLHIDRPLPGQRVLDLQNVIRFKKAKQTHLMSNGPSSCLAALHAAALDTNLQSVTLEGALLSWSNVVRTPISYNQLTNVVPGVLKHYDLPELATMIAPRPLTVRNPVDAQGRPVSQKQLEETYAVTREHYRKLGAEKNLILEGAK